MAQVAVQEQMQSSLRNCIQPTFDQVKQSTEARHLNVEDDMTSLEMALSRRFSEDLFKSHRVYWCFPTKCLDVSERIIFATSIQWRLFFDVWSIINYFFTQVYALCSIFPPPFPFLTFPVSVHKVLWEVFRWFYRVAQWLIYVPTYDMFALSSSPELLHDMVDPIFSWRIFLIGPLLSSVIRFWWAPVWGV